MSAILVAGLRPGWQEEQAMAVVQADRRETFYEAQARHRRSGWRFSLLTVMAVLLLGLPVSVLISPFIAAVGLIGVDVANEWTPMPDPVGELGRLMEDIGDTGEATEPAPADDPARVPDSTLLAVGIGLFVPGLLFMGLVWLCVRRLMLRSGAGAMALAAGARPPSGDLEERQLVNLVEEMALAAGVPPPRVMVVDSPDANCAVAGRSIHDVTVVVPRGLLDQLGRQPTGAIIADMLAVVVNGDLRVALVISSAFQTFDVVGAMLAAPLSRRTRRVLWRTFRLSFRRRSRRGDGAEEQFLAGELTELAMMGAMDDSKPRGCLALVQLPFLVAAIAYSLTRLLVGGFIVAPIMGAMWRRRRLLADATAVEMTRDPDALATALTQLRDNGATVPPGPWTHLFAIGPELDRERKMQSFERRRDEIWTSEEPGESGVGSFARRTRLALAASADLRNDMAEPVPAAGPGTATSSPSGASTELAGFLPPLGKRVERLAAMGAYVRADPNAPIPGSKPHFNPATRTFGWVVGIVMMAIMGVLFLCLFGCLAGFIYLAFLFEMMLLVPIVAIAHALLR
jgi:Zn-dependent protease with chaperone function